MTHPERKCVCETCRWWKVKDDPHIKGYGNCHRNAPVGYPYIVQIIAEYLSEIGFKVAGEIKYQNWNGHEEEVAQSYIFPETTELDFCGEYSPTCQGTGTQEGNDE